MTRLMTINRRNFFKIGATLGAGVIAAPALNTVEANQSSPNGASANKDTRTRSLGTGKHSIQVAYGLGLGCMGMS